MTTGERMKARRKELGLSAEAIAERLGVSPATIYRYENGDIDKVPGERLESLAIVLHTSPAYLMGWADDPSPESDTESTTKDLNIVRIAGRDGRYIEKRLTDDQVKALQAIIEQLPEADNDQL